MINIGTLNNEPGATINAQTITQNNTQVTIQPSVTAPKGETMGEPKRATKNAKKNPTPAFTLNPDFKKVDFLRVINAMCEAGLFVKLGSRVKADKKDVFAAFGTILGENFSRAYSNLGSGIDFSPDNAQSVTEDIFDTLKKAAVNYNAGAQSRKQNK